MSGRRWIIPKSKPQKRLRQAGDRYAFERALRQNDADGLLAILASPEGGAVQRTWPRHSYIPAKRGDVACLRILHKHGFSFNSRTWEEAASHGHRNCLEFAVRHGYMLEDSVLAPAVYGGHLACVELLLRQGLPQKPCALSMPLPGPEQLKCIQLMFDRKAAVDPQTLIAAACQGDVDFVRFLHQRGVPLWQEAQDATLEERQRYWDPFPRWASAWDSPEPPGAIAIPLDTHALEDMWKALRYGAVFGAPVTPRVVALFTKKRQRTHAVLACFKAAARLRKRPGRAPQRRRVWAGMAALPSELVEEILILADLEIPESVMRRLPLQAPAVAP